VIDVSSRRISSLGGCKCYLFRPGKGFETRGMGGEDRSVTPGLRYLGFCYTAERIS